MARELLTRPCKLDNAPSNPGIKQLAPVFPVLPIAFFEERSASGVLTEMRGDDASLATDAHDPSLPSAGQVCCDATMPSF
jgi:hypothetical protein